MIIEYIVIFILKGNLTKSIEKLLPLTAHIQIAQVVSKPVMGIRLFQENGSLYISEDLILYHFFP